MNDEEVLGDEEVLEWFEEVIDAMRRVAPGDYNELDVLLAYSEALGDEMSRRNRERWAT